jgi:hypothetical protein
MTYHVNDSTLCTLVNSEYFHEEGSLSLLDNDSLLYSTLY